MDETPSPWGQAPKDQAPKDQPPKDKDERRKKNSGRGGPAKPGGGFLKWAIAGGLVILLIVWLFPGGSSFGEKGSAILYDIFLLLLVGAGLLAHVMSEPGKALRQAAGWVIIFGIFMVGYSLWNGSGQLGGELDPAKGFSDNNSISYRADERGHYIVRAQVNGVDVRFLIDTGASDVALSAQDAQRIGFDLNRLVYNKAYNTANGLAFAAPVILDEISLGPIRANNITASVSREGLEHSLLGMSFLNSLSGYKVVDGVLTLYP